MVHTHAELVKQGVEAQLNIWEGLDHGFFYDSDLPQSRDMYEVTTKFFAKHLGKR